MADAQVTQYSTNRKIRQPPAVPFLWEEKPGLPKKDWKPGPTPVTPAFSPPVKLIASVPFNWEEKPGKPLSSFSQPPPPGDLITFDDVYEGRDDDHNEHLKGLFELDLETFDFDTDDSFSSAPSLLANCLLSSDTISSALPLEEFSFSDNTSTHLEGPATPASETDSSTSSYETGATSSLVGPSFLERLFPLLSPSSGFLEKVGNTGKGPLTPAGENINDEKGPNSPPGVKFKDLDRDSDNSIVIRRPPTLGELIMMSRRRSYQRKAAVHLRNQNLSMELMKRASRCCIIGNGIKMIDGMQRKRYQATLKLLYK